MKKINKNFSINFKKKLTEYSDRSKDLMFDLGKNAFLLILIMFLINVLFGEILFYKYVFLVNFGKSEENSSVVKFKDNLYSSVLKEWQKREEVFNSLPESNYQNPFL